MLCPVVWQKLTDVSKMFTASIIRAMYHLSKVRYLHTLCRENMISHQDHFLPRRFLFTNFKSSQLTLYDLGYSLNNPAFPKLF